MTRFQIEQVLEERLLLVKVSKRNEISFFLKKKW